MRGGNMRDPMKPVVPLMAEEMENLENLKKYMDDNEYHAYLEKRALEALVRYRAKSNLEDLEEMQFFMHRITHNIIEGVKKTEELNAQKEQIRRLNILSSIHEGDDG
jgi:predicted house-cleaning noncanonical NTP pyrophosphatase (MazG superfamily)